MKKKGLLERLAAGPVLGDGGYLLELEKRGWVRAGPFTPGSGAGAPGGAAGTASGVSRGGG